MFGKKPPMPPTRPGLREFDYFSDRPALHPGQSVGIRISDGEADEAATADGIRQRALLRARVLRRQALWHALIAAIFLGACGTFIYGLWDPLRYAFAAPHAPKLLGDVADITPAAIAHNTFVEVQGITEHRGFSQEIFRGLALRRETYWYFRLLGSRGVFIEVPAREAHIGYTQQVTVRGRAVDPAREKLYHQLMRAYRERYPTQVHSQEARIIQVDVLPGAHRRRYAVMLGVLGLLSVVTVTLLLRFVSLSRRAAHGARTVLGA